MNIRKDQVKKIVIITFIALISFYVIWDISLKVTNRFRLQGYEHAIMEVVRQAENEDCNYFNIFTGEKEINLINVDCLQMINEGEDSMIGETIPGDDFEGFPNDSQ